MGWLFGFDFGVGLVVGFGGFDCGGLQVLCFALVGCLLLGRFGFDGWLLCCDCGGFGL